MLLEGYQLIVFGFRLSHDYLDLLGVFLGVSESDCRPPSNEFCHSSPGTAGSYSLAADGSTFL